MPSAHAIRTCRYFSSLLTLALLLPIGALADETAAIPDTDRVNMQWSIKIPLRDGVHLSATVYTPRDQKSPAPCIFTLTPYIAQSYHDRGIYFASHGYPFLTVDVRGRGNSEGEFRPLIQEAKDGYDVVEWLARQPYCNGKVSMWGGSYAGYDQWATAKEFPPHLATIVPVAAPFAGVDFPMQENISDTYLMQWLTFTSGHASQDKIFGDRFFWASKNRQWLESGAPFMNWTLRSGILRPRSSYGSHMRIWMSIGTVTTRRPSSTQSSPFPFSRLRAAMTTISPARSPIIRST